MASSPEAAGLEALSSPAISGSARGVVSALLVFGDSLSDVGNAFAQRGAAAFPCPPHWRGRRCDGPVWVEHLAARLGLPPLLPSLAGGSNHAFGGARSGRGLSAKGMPNLLEQVEGFLGEGRAAEVAGLRPAAGPDGLMPRSGSVGPGPGAPPSSSAAGHWRSPAVGPDPSPQNLAAQIGSGSGLLSADPATALVVLRAGANDYLDAPPSPSVAEAVNSHLLEAMSRLAAAGFRRFLVPSELPWGWAPLELPGVQQEQRLALNALITAQNRALRASLTDLAAGRQLLVAQPDAAALLLAVRDDPAAHGFSEVDRPRLSGGGLEAAEAVPEASGWLWWDSWGHLSSAFHRQLAERALESLRGCGLAG